MTDTHVLSMLSKTPTQQRGERRVAELLRAAEQLFATVGYEGTTMSGVASLAAASIGSLYQFFPSKESLGSTLLLGYMDELGARLDQWKTTLPDTPRAFGRGLITIVFDYISKRPAWSVLAEAPSLMPNIYPMEKLAARLQDLLLTFAPSMKNAELSAISLTASFMVRTAVQGSLAIDAKKGVLLRREMQWALGSYLEERIGAGVSTTAATGRKRLQSTRADEYDGA